MGKERLAKDHSENGMLYALSHAAFSPHAVLRQKLQQLVKHTHFDPCSEMG